MAYSSPPRTTPSHPPPLRRTRPRAGKTLPWAHRWSKSDCARAGGPASLPHTHALNGALMCGSIVDVPGTQVVEAVLLHHPQEETESFGS